MDLNILQKKEIIQEIEITELLVKDLKRLRSSYANKAFKAKQERELKQDKKGFLDCNSIPELQDLYGYGDIDEATYRRGIEYFESLNVPVELSTVERYRLKLKDMISKAEGTIKELNDELNPTEKVTPENIFKKMDREEREQRYKSMI